MSVASIIDQATGKIYDDLIPQGGGVPLTKGQLISADALGNEVAVPTGANGTILSADPNQDDGLRWIAVPGAVALAQGQLISANLAGDATIVTAPNLPAQANWVLTADGTAGANGTNMDWKPATGGGGLITANAPLFDDATQNPNKIGINFSASVGEIPYGNGTAKVGALTVAPNPASSNQFLGTNAGVPTWKDVGGSGTITATAPLTEYAIASASNVAIDFTAQGDLVVGNGPQAGGNPAPGVILPAGTEGQILSVASTGIGGLKWIDNTNNTGKQIVVRSNALTKAIDPPTDPKDTLVLVAEETTSAWDAIPLDITYTGEYNCEFASGTVGPPGQESNYVGLVNKIDGFRVVELWRQQAGQPASVKIGYFCNYSYSYNILQPSNDAFIRVVEGFSGTGSNLDDNVLIGGCFNTFVYTTTTPPANVIAYSICKLGSVSGLVSNLDTVSNATGLGDEWIHRNDGVNGVWSINFIPAGVWATPRPTVWIMGHFSAILYEGTQTSNNGYFSMVRYFPEANGTAEYQTIQDTGFLGYGVLDGGGLASGYIYDAYFYGNFCAIAGVNTGLKTDSLNFIPVPAGMEGFSIMDATATAVNRWGTTPTGPTGIADGRCVRPSLTQATSLIVGGEVSGAPAYLYNTSTNNTSLITPSSPATFPAVMLENSIANGSIVVVGGSPAVAVDALYFSPTNGTISYVYYLTTATGSVAQLLTPTPTGVVGGDENGIQTAWGIKINPTQDFPQNVMIISGATSLYQYDPAVPHANIDFTLALPNGFRQGNTITNTARFVQPAFQSQSYISSADKTYWIQTGGTTTGLTYF